MYNQFICSLLLLVAASSTYAAAIKGSKHTCISDHSCLVSVKGKGGGRICAGVLTDSKTVVTAATCLAFYDAEQLEVAVHNDTKIVQIARYTSDPYFDFVTMENDIAILKLAEPVKASYLELPKKQPASGSKGALIRWDANNTVAEFAEIILSIKDCASGKYNYNKHDLFDTMFCGLPEDTDTCGGPAGSPLVYKNQLVGLLSWGYGCGNKGHPAVYTSVASLLSWIERNTANL